MVVVEVGRGGQWRAVVAAVACSWLTACAAGANGKSSTPDESREDEAAAATPKNPNMKPLVVDEGRCSAKGRTDPIDLNLDGRHDVVSIYDGPQSLGW